MAAVWSSLLGFMDVVAGTKYKYASNKEKILVNGWGDESIAPTELMQKIDVSGLEGFDEIEMHFQATEQDSSTDAVKVTRGSFTSPLANEYIHEENKVGYVELVEPRESSELKGCIVLLAMTGDHGFGYRRKTLAMPLAAKGYAVASLMIPYYGKRIPEGQHQHYIRTVYEYSYAGVGCFVEGAALVNWMSKHFGQDLPVAIGGLSFGGIGSVAAAALTQRDVILVPCLAGTSAVGILRGMLKGIVKLPKEFSKEDRQNVFEYMEKELDVARIVEAMAKKDYWKKKKMLVHQVNAKNDWIIVPGDRDVLQELMKEHSTAYSCNLTNGGHVSSITNAKKLFVPEFLKAFEEYEALNTLNSSL